MGQSRWVGLDGASERPYHVVGMRVRRWGHPGEEALREGFQSLLDHEFDTILTAHNPVPLDSNPKSLYDTYEDGDKRRSNRWDMAR